jgi:hypothetical protein
VAYKKQEDRPSSPPLLTVCEENASVGGVGVGVLFDDSQIKPSPIVQQLLNIVNQPKMYKKTPKLAELYKHLYPENPPPENLHDALVDTTICMKCFIKMKYKGRE